MEIYLHKILPVFALPTGGLLILLVLGLFFRHRGIIGLALLLFWLASMPCVSERMVQAVEGDAIRQAVSSMPEVDAIVVLSEGRPVAPGVHAISEWGDGDRFWGGVELYLAGKAPLLLFTGGWAPWIPSAPPDGEVLITYARRVGIPDEALRTTGKVVNTVEEARETARLLKPRAKVLLVTSAFHMVRAQRQFENEGLTVIPFPVDFKTNAARVEGVMDFVPNAASFMSTEMAWRELLGRAYYRLRKLTG